MKAGLTWIVVSIFLPLTTLFVGPWASELYNRIYVIPGTPTSEGIFEQTLRWLATYKVHEAFWMATIPCLVMLGFGLMCIARQSRQPEASA